MVKAFLLPPSLPSFKIVSLIEGNVQAGALDCEESCSPALAVQRAAADGGDVDWYFPGRAEQPWEAAAPQAGLEAGLCFPGAKALTFTQSRACRHPTRSPHEWSGNVLLRRLWSARKASSEIAGWPQACRGPDLMLLGQLRSFPSANLTQAFCRQQALCGLPTNPFQRTGSLLSQRRAAAGFRA